MKAKDTVMNDIKLLQLLLGLHDGSTITGYAAGQDMNTAPGLYFKMGAQAQAETSFKAGIKEVVGWLDVYQNELGFCGISNHVDFGDWQEKLKEWGMYDGEAD